MSIQKWSSFEDIVDFSDFWRFFGDFWPDVACVCVRKSAPGLQKPLSTLGTSQNTPQLHSQASGPVKRALWGPQKQKHPKIRWKIEKMAVFWPPQKKIIYLYFLIFGIFPRDLTHTLLRPLSGWAVPPAQTKIGHFWSFPPYLGPLAQKKIKKGPFFKKTAIFGPKTPEKIGKNENFQKSKNGSAVRSVCPTLRISKPNSKKRAPPPPQMGAVKNYILLIYR